MEGFEPSRALLKDKGFDPVSSLLCNQHAPLSSILGAVNRSLKHAGIGSK